MENAKQITLSHYYERKKKKYFCSISSTVELDFFQNANTYFSYGWRKEKILTLSTKTHKYLEFTRLLNTAY